MQRIKKGDLVIVTAGSQKIKGKSGKVLEIVGGDDPNHTRVRIEGVLPVKRHLKPGVDPKVPNGGIVERFGTIHISNVMPVDPQTKKPTRVGMKKLDDNRKVRVAKRSGETLSG